MIRTGSFNLNAGTSCNYGNVDKHITVSNIELIYRFAPNSPIYDETIIDQKWLLYDSSYNKVILQLSPKQPIVVKFNVYIEVFKDTSSIWYL